MAETPGLSGGGGDREDAAPPPLAEDGEGLEAAAAEERLHDAEADEDGVGLDDRHPQRGNAELDEPGDEEHNRLPPGITHVHEQDHAEQRLQDGEQDLVSVLAVDRQGGYAAEADAGEDHVLSRLQ